MKSLQGKLLLASPTLLDPNFVQTVVLIVQHEDGAVGLVVNRPLKARLQQAWQQIQSEITCNLDVPLYQGGPCPGPLMVLHNRSDHAELELPGGICFSTEREHIEWLVQNTTTEPVRFCVGYSGWSAGQLEHEINEGSWVIAPATGDRIFKDDPQLWERMMRLTHPNVFLNPSSPPGDPSNN